MDFQLFDIIPVSAVCFKKDFDSDPNSDIQICRCNKAFMDLFKADLNGMTAKNFPDRFKDLFAEIKDKVYNGEKNFSLSFEHHYFSINAEFCEGYCCVFIDALCDILNMTLNTVNDGIIFTDRNFTVTYFNAAAKNLAGLTEHDFGKNLTAVFPTYKNESSPVYDFNSYINKGFNVTKSDGSTAVVTLKELHSNENGTYVYLLSDITQFLNYQNALDFYKNHDLLTGLYNRITFEKLVNEKINSGLYPISIIIGDINGLHIINEILGKRRGDSVLLTVANIFTLACRDSDIIARYGGDTFVVALPDTTLEETKRICKNILSLCSTENSKISKISVSLGYSCLENQCQSFDEALSVAEDFMMRHKMLEVKSYRSSFLDSLKGMLYTKSFETEKHALRITSLCQKIGKIMGLSDSELNDLGLFSMLHDIGKIGIKDSVLMKPGKLTEEEWTEMRKHSILGYRIAKTAPELENIATDILYHHERFDGKGYPEGLKGEKIPLLSRILAVADSYDAMVNDRCYRKALPKETAVAEIKRCSGTQFDPKVVDCFLKVIDTGKTQYKEAV